ncbi:MAG: hypothetical protein COX77_02630 [Candidatus Komeilibacteria bacterium CG_4_10_14_0_2_um_filter_37_10]|uniref:Glycosyl transferase family 28 C-terminal domain-containing protein n=1 Tax=Candidatus Komeilibacteria bacterium CG_4_10_14_0_2_um_filter_37_10 TaxID=1974470 RepID=A0A2M7VEX4_9BACT|nr:MAG: hypothetical protein COX77_02630 [Candidatus Komeilibacteria bacterium CG_4_10_14_0_2_um_filter_37_10]
MWKRASVVAVDMGYGHLRAAYPLRHLSPDGQIILANNYPGIPAADLQLWNGSSKFYEYVSRLNNIPLIGTYLFAAFDYFQKIPNFYPRRDLSKPTLQLKTVYRSIALGWGKHLVEYLNKQQLPLVTTFFTVAYIAEENGFNNEIYLVLCDTDVSRAWAALQPGKSRIKYLVPCHRVQERLLLYGVKKENIYLTGFPLPKEIIGGEKMDLVKHDLSIRIANLDPQKKYQARDKSRVYQFLRHCGQRVISHRPLTIAFAVGGAGAQKYMAYKILTSLKAELYEKRLIINLIAGSRKDVFQYFNRIIRELKMENLIDNGIRIIYAPEKTKYFELFTKSLRDTDALWSKPSELSFYSALGLPIIMAQCIGSQEKYNRRWLLAKSRGIDQEPISYVHQWFMEWINSGILAEVAASAYINGRQLGTYNIERVVANHPVITEIESCQKNKKRLLAE